MWGVLPIYFKAIADIAAVDIVAHRVVWSLPFLALLCVTARLGRGPRGPPAPRTLGPAAVTALLIGVNWLLYVYAVNSGHILAGKPRLLSQSARQRAAWPVRPQGAPVVAAVDRGRDRRGRYLALAVGALGQLWISLTLCVSFATYGLLRKIARVDAVAGLAIETALLFPLAAALARCRRLPRRSRFSAHDRLETGLLIARRDRLDDAFAAVHRRRAAPALFDPRDAAVHRPDAAVPDRASWLYGEPFTPRPRIAFGAIWTALALYVSALIRAPRAPQAPE